MLFRDDPAFALGGTSSATEVYLSLHQYPFGDDWAFLAIQSPCEVIPIAQPKFTKMSMPDNPLLKVPPARRGNRVSAPLAVPLAKRGEP